MDNFQQQIHEAEIILSGSSDPDQKAQVLDELRQVVEKADRSRKAEVKRARELLDRYTNSGPPKRDRELAHYERRWNELQGLHDGRLFELLGELKEKPHIATRLFPAVITSLRAWIEKATENITDFNPEEVLVLNKFIDVITQVDIYRVELADLKELHNALFRRRYAEVSHKIFESVEAWDDQEAWRQLDLLEDAPADLAETVGALRERIYAMCNVKQKVEALLHHWPQSVPTSWADVGALVRSPEEAFKIHQEHYIPQQWDKQLKERTEKALDLAGQFLMERAKAVSSISDVRRFWENYQNLSLSRIHDELKPQGQWFQRFLEHTRNRVSLDVQRAENPQALDVISTRLLKEKAELPTFINSEGGWLLSNVMSVSAAWDAMVTGADFAVPDSTQLPLPQQFVNDTAIYSEWLDQIQTAFAKLEVVDEHLSEELYREALGVAQSVLDQKPDHLLATQLKEKANFGIARLQVDSALSVWDFTRLIELSKTLREKPAFGYFVDNEEELRLWLEPYVNREKLTTWEGAQLWWANWKTAVGKIPRQPPDSLMKAMRREEEKRRDEWAEVLGELINQDLAPEECEEIADSLKEGSESLHVQSFQQSFRLKADVGKADRCITNREWDEAQRIIGSLDENYHDTRTIRRLKLRLEVERAKEAGVDALAKVLKSEWGIFKSSFDDPLALLINAIEDAWREERDEAIVILGEVARRELTREHESNPQLEQIRQWHDWFMVEQAIKSDESATSLRQLISYIKNHKQSEAMLQKRIERLVHQWQKQRSLVMLALVDQMFDWVSLAQDPEEILKEDSDKTSVRVLDRIERQADIELEQLLTLQQEVSVVDTAWRTLAEYRNLVKQSLNLTTQVSPRLRPSKRFEEAKLLLGHLIKVKTDLAELVNADLRQPMNKEKLDVVIAILQRELPSNVRSREKLLTQATRLEPLSKLNSIENNIVNYARLCGSERDVDFYEPGAFTNLAGKLRELIGRFHEAQLVQQKGQPSQMWRIVSEEYTRKVYELACIYAPRPPGADLKRLAAKMDELDKQERKFRDLMDKIWNAKPSLGADSTFNPGQHDGFLKNFPQTPPLSRRDYLFFKYRCAEAEPLKNIISQSRDKLPAWIQTYLEKDIPQCADEI
jgi:hypothetical protein